jgi:hypothetical protein
MTKFIVSPTYDCIHHIWLGRIEGVILTVNMHLQLASKNLLEAEKYQPSVIIGTRASHKFYSVL